MKLSLKAATVDSRPGCRVSHVVSLWSVNGQWMVIVSLVAATRRHASLRTAVMQHQNWPRRRPLTRITLKNWRAPPRQGAPHLLTNDVILRPRDA